MTEDRSGALPTRRDMIVGTVLVCSALGIGSRIAFADDDGISQTCASIHEEVISKATSKRVYDALIDATQFSRVIQLSAAAKSGASSGDEPVVIGYEAGGELNLFGGYVTGRQIELVPNQRIVQAWRAGSWDPGIYSIARFELTEQRADAKLAFDHTGFPVDQAQHLAIGWKINYWEPLAKYLA